MPTRPSLAACLRDMDYYLRYATYALVAGSMDVLDERVLQGLRKLTTVPIVRRFIQSEGKVAAAGIENTAFWMSRLTT